MPLKVFNLIIVDESGSMESIKHATITGFNELIQSIHFEAEKDPELEQYIQFYSFNSGGIREQIPLGRVGEVTRLDETNYRPNNMTPLYDAIGYATGKLRFVLEKEEDYTVLVTILTDGAENASKEFTRVTIANIIRELEKQNWVFTYIGAHEMAREEAISLSIKHSLQINADMNIVTEEMKKEKHRRSRFYDALKSQNMDMLRRDYFAPDDENKGDKGKK